MNNLSSFRPDGSATCAYLYPDVVNGEPGRFADPLANDQDWALVLLMQAARIDPSLLGEVSGQVPVADGGVGDVQKVM
jgi:hypothetical protein